MDFFSTNLLLLFILSIASSFVGATTGGSALVNIPAMVWLGVPAHSAIATARLAAASSMAASITPFHKEGKVDYRLALPASLWAIAGALVGAKTLLLMPEELVKKSIGGITLLMVLLSFMKKKDQTPAAPLSKMRLYFGYFSFFFVGLWGGFFGGQAILATYIFLLLFNKTITESIGTRKVTGLAISLAAILFYGLHGIVDWQLGATLMIGSWIGAHFGTRFALKKGEKWIEYFFTGTTLLLSTRLIFF